MQQDCKEKRVNQTVDTFSGFIRFHEPMGILGALVNVQSK